MRKLSNCVGRGDVDDSKQMSSHSNENGGWEKGIVYFPRLSLSK